MIKRWLKSQLSGGSVRLYIFFYSFFRILSWCAQIETCAVNEYISSCLFECLFDVGRR